MAVFLCTWTLAEPDGTFLLVLERVIRPIRAGPLCPARGTRRRLLVSSGFLVSGSFVVAAAVAAIVLGDQMSSAIFDHGAAILAVSSPEWWVFAAAFGLLGATLVTAGSDPDGWALLDKERVLVGLTG